MRERRAEKTRRGSVGGAHRGGTNSTTPGPGPYPRDLKMGLEGSLTPGVDGDERRAGVPQLAAKRYRLPDGVEEAYLDEYWYRHRSPPGAHDVQDERSIVDPEQVRTEATDVRGPLGAAEVQVDRVAVGLDEPRGVGKDPRIVRGEVRNKGTVPRYRLEVAHAGEVVRPSVSSPPPPSWRPP